ncbi:MAG: hypothetical protein RMI94_05265, partial [Bryobacterales bacterium]|nr:hypothetical protein [Bryobacterales bacterium]
AVMPLEMLKEKGIPVLAISCVTNMAAGLAPGPLSHSEVLETGRLVRDQLERLLEVLLPRLLAEIERGGEG